MTAPVIELPDLTSVARTAGAEAQLAMAELEDLEASFNVWQELRQAHGASQARFEAEVRRVTAEGELLIGALRAPGLAHSTALTAGQSLDSEARRALATALEQLELQRQQADQEFSRARGALFDLLSERVALRTSRVRPVIRLMLRRLVGDRRILHAARPDPDEAVSLLWALSGRLPSRFDFLFDDSTDDPTQEPQGLYAEEGVTAADGRPTPGRALQLLSGLPQVWPVKGMLPLLVDGLMARWRERGAVMEAEVADGDAWRNVLSASEAEQITGYLLALKVSGRIVVEIGRG